MKLFCFFLAFHLSAFLQDLKSGKDWSKGERVELTTGRKLRHGKPRRNDEEFEILLPAHSKCLPIGASRLLSLIQETHALYLLTQQARHTNGALAKTHQISVLNNLGILANFQRYHVWDTLQCFSKCAHKTGSSLHFCFQHATYFFVVSSYQADSLKFVLESTVTWIVIDWCSSMRRV